MCDLHELPKLPNLFDHYQEHQQTGGELSFFAFVDLHYGSKARQHEQEHNGRHESLPFKSHNCTLHKTTCLIPTFQPPVMAQETGVVTYSNRYQSTTSTQFAATIWQPPRIA